MLVYHNVSVSVSHNSMSNNSCLQTHSGFWVQMAFVQGFLQYYIIYLVSMMFSVGHMRYKIVTLMLGEELVFMLAILPPHSHKNTNRNKGQSHV